MNSAAAHPGLTKTNLLSGASYGRDRPTLQARLTQLTWRLLPFMWLDVDEGIKPSAQCRRITECRGREILRSARLLRNRWRGSHIRRRPAPRSQRCRQTAAVAALRKTDRRPLSRLTRSCLMAADRRGVKRMAFVGRSDVRRSRRPTASGGTAGAAARAVIRRGSAVPRCASRRVGGRGGPQARAADRRGHGDGAKNPWISDFVPSRG